MPPTIILVRHGEGYHDLPPQLRNQNIRDPLLTSEGISQCQELCQTFPFHSHVTKLCASPLRRTLQTAQYGFDPVIKRLGLVVALPDAQEAQDLPSDTGTPLDALREQFTEGIDWAELEQHPYWYRKIGRYEDDHQVLQERARRLRFWFKGQHEQLIVLASHGKFLHYVTEDVGPNGEQLGDYWTNCQWRAFRFDEKKEKDASLHKVDPSVLTKDFGQELEN